MEARILQELFLSEVLGKPIVDARGYKIGRLRDMAVRWDVARPAVTGIKYAKDIQNHIATAEVLSWDNRELRLRRRFSDTLTQQLQPDEIYVGKWLLDKQIIDMKGSKLVRVNDIKLAWVEYEEGFVLVLAAVDIGVRGLFRRVGAEFLVKNRENRLLPSTLIMPLETRTADLQLKTTDFSQISIGKLHPADIADIIEDLSHPRRLELIRKLDSQTAAEVLSEVEPDTREEIIDDLEDSDASTILQEMAPDEAADVLGQLSRERSDQLLTMMQAEDATDIRKLMQYPVDTAGALMTTEYIFFSPETTAAETIEGLREMGPSAETIYYLYVVDENHRLQGVVSLRQLIVAPPEQTLSQIMETRVVSIDHNDTPREVAETIAKYDLLAVPVVDQQGIMLGIVTVDDAIEYVLPDRSSLETFSHYLLRSKLTRRQKS